MNPEEDRTAGDDEAPAVRNAGRSRSYALLVAGIILTVLGIVPVFVALAWYSATLSYLAGPPSSQVAGNMLMSTIVVSLPLILGILLIIVWVRHRHRDNGANKDG